MYNKSYWTDHVPEYLDESWSSRPSPFAKLASKFFPKGARILELGTGAGQDGLWFAAQGYKVIATDATDAAFEEIRVRAKRQRINSLRLAKLDISEAFNFPNSSFDVIYAQLVLHYFDDETMTRILKEISRVLASDGLVAFMVNSTKDEEYSLDRVGGDGLIEVKGLSKRYFDLATFKPFTSGFKELLFDDKGRTPKDDQKGNSGMVEFIGKKA